MTLLNRTILTTATCLVAAGLAWGATTPFTETFDADPPSDFVELTEGGGDAWTVTGGAYEYTRDTGTGSTTFNDSSLVPITNLPAGVNFKASTDFTLTGNVRESGVEEILEFGVQVLGNSDSSSAYAALFRTIEAVPGTDGNRFLLAQGDLTAGKSAKDGGSQQQVTPFTVAENVAHELQVSGHYLANGDFRLTAGVSDGGTPTILQHTDTSGSPLAGQQFGYYTRAKRMEAAVSYDNFSVTAKPAPTVVASSSFSAGDPPAGFVETPESGDPWSVTGGAYVFDRNLGNSSTVFEDFTLIQSPDVPAGSDFTVSTDFELRSSGVTGSGIEHIIELGLAFGANSDLSSGYAALLRTNESVPGTDGNLLFLAEGDIPDPGKSAVNNGTAIGSTEEDFTLQLDTVYSLTAQFTELVFGQYEIAVDITDGVNAAGFVFVDDSPTLGDHFGYFVRSKRRDVEIAFDNFELLGPTPAGPDAGVIPEPVSLALFGLAGATLYMRRR